LFQEPNEVLHDRECRSSAGWRQGGWKGDRNHANRKAEVAWNGRGHYSSGAWVNYDETSWLFPSATFVAYQKDLPASAAPGKLR